MSTTPPACTQRGCKATKIHHHSPSGSRIIRCLPGDCAGATVSQTESFSPRPSRKFLAAEVARLSAELADVHDEVADKKDRLARAELQAESDALVIASLGQQIAATPEPEPVDPDAAIVEAMAEAAMDTWYSPGNWANRPESNREDWRTNMRAALAAAREAGAL